MDDRGERRVHCDLRGRHDHGGADHHDAGRAALGDPWIFGGLEVTREEAARFLVEYAELLKSRHGTTPRGRAGRVKQLLRHWVAGGLVPDEERESWLGERDHQQLFQRLVSQVGPPTRV